MITYPSDELVWAEQDNFNASGTFNWELEIPDTWADVRYTVTVMDLEAEVTDIGSFDLQPPPKRTLCTTSGLNTSLKTYPSSYSRRVRRPWSR